MTSGAFTEAYQQLVEQFQKTTRHTVVTTYGASMGGAKDSIPVRLDRGAPVDVVIVIDTAHGALAKSGHVQPATRVEIARSMIGIAVRKGAPKPDSSTVAALKQTLLNAISDYVGLLPADVQQVSMVSAAIGTKSASPAAARELRRAQ